MNQNLEERLAPIAYPVEIENANYIVGTEHLSFDKQNHSPPQIKGRVYVDRINEVPANLLRFFKSRKKRIFQSSLNLTRVCGLNGFESFYTALIYLADNPDEFKEKDIKYFEKLFSGIYQHYKSLR